MLYEEFLKGTKKEHNIQMQYAFEVINEMYMKNELDTKEDCYMYFKKNEKKVLIASLGKANAAFIEAKGFVHKQICDVTKKIRQIKNEIDTIALYQTKTNKIDELQKQVNNYDKQRNLLYKSLDGFADIGFYR